MMPGKGKNIYIPGKNEEKRKNRSNLNTLESDFPAASSSSFGLLSKWTFFLPPCIASCYLLFMIIRQLLPATCLLFGVCGGAKKFI